ncbi:MAG: hypothetical protein C5B51_28155 [Terriglobia bacterium]|nr:MAG: hypothetical protein C5B51_28155 [Terriglobia bacterium]
MSVSNGQYIIPDMVAEWDQPLIERIQALPYITAVRVSWRDKKETEPRLELRTRRGLFVVDIARQRSHLSDAAINALLAEQHEVPLIVFARYITRPAGERLAKAGLNFVDESGNLHLSLGNEYHTFVLGNPDKRREPEHRRVGTATVQTLFALLANPAAIAYPARQLAQVAGVGKSAASEAKQRLLAEGILESVPDAGSRIVDLKRLESMFLEGYTQVLRPALVLGRFRSQERDPERWVQRLAAVAKEKEWRWALSGSAGAFALDRYYRGDRTAVFISASPKAISVPLALLPDKQGPITLFRWFSPVLVSPNGTPYPVAHPWLLYAELLQTNDPRALEAAGEIEKKYLHAPSVT